MEIFAKFSNTSNKNGINNIEEYIFCGLSSIGAITSIINAFVFLNRALKDQIFNFYIVSSLVDFIYSIVIAFMVLIECGSICDNIRGLHFLTHFYRIYLDDYLTSSLAINNILIEIFLSTQRFFIISNKKCLQSISSIRIILIVFCFSLLFYSPVLFLKRIVSIDQHNSSFNSTTNGYKLEYTEFGNSSIGRALPLILSSIRFILASVILFLINLFTLIKFRKHVNKKSNLKLKLSKLMGNF